MTTDPLADAIARYNARLTKGPAWEGPELPDTTGPLASAKWGHHMMTGKLWKDRDPIEWPDPPAPVALFVPLASPDPLPEE